MAHKLRPAAAAIKVAELSVLNVLGSSGRRHTFPHLFDHRAVAFLATVIPAPTIDPQGEHLGLPDQRPHSLPESVFHSLFIPTSVPAERKSRSEEHTSELQSRLHLVCRLLLEKKKISRTT